MPATAHCQHDTVAAAARTTALHSNGGLAQAQRLALAIHLHHGAVALGCNQGDALETFARGCALGVLPLTTTRALLPMNTG